MKQKDIDLSDLPEMREWAGEVVGKSIAPSKSRSRSELMLTFLRGSNPREKVIKPA